MLAHNRSLLIFVALVAGCLTAPSEVEVNKTPDSPAAEPFTITPISDEIGTASCPSDVSLLANGGPPGGEVQFNWCVRGEETELVSTEVWFGAEPVSEPTVGSYPFATKALDILPSFGRRPLDPHDIAAAGTMPLEGVLYARARAEFPGREVWSDEIRLDAKGEAPLKILSEVPTQVEAGKPFVVRFAVEGLGGVSPLRLVATPHLPLVFSDRPARDPGPDQVLLFGQPRAPYDAPLNGSLNVTLPAPGTWFLRAQVSQSGGTYASEMARVVAALPTAPNLQEYSITPLDERCFTDRWYVCSGAPIRASGQVNGPDGMSASRVGIAFSEVSSSTLGETFAPDSWTGSTLFIPLRERTLGPFEFEFALEGTGVRYIRLYAEVAGQHIWGPESTLELASAPS